MFRFLSNDLFNPFFPYAESSGKAAQMIRRGAVRRKTKTEIKEAEQAEKLRAAWEQAREAKISALEE